MYIYRIIDEEKYMNGELLNDKSEWVNSFDYDEGKEYVHFFVLPEFAEIYQENQLKQSNKKTLVLQCEVPYSLIKDNFGIGMYRWYNSINDPVLEVRLDKENFDMDMVRGIAHEVPRCWKNEKIYKRYLDNVINSFNYPMVIDETKDIIDQIEGKPQLSPRFNFLNYFPDSQLKEEGLRNGYCHGNEYNDVEIKDSNKSFLDKLKSLFNKNKSR